MIRVQYLDLKSIFHTNKFHNQIYHDINFWAKKLMRDYSIFDNINPMDKYDQCFFKRCGDIYPLKLCLIAAINKKGIPDWYKKDIDRYTYNISFRDYFNKQQYIYLKMVIDSFSIENKLDMSELVSIIIKHDNYDLIIDVIHALNAKGEDAAIFYNSIITEYILLEKISRIKKLHDYVNSSRFLVIKSSKTEVINIDQIILKACSLGKYKLIKEYIENNLYYQNILHRNINKYIYQSIDSENLNIAELFLNKYKSNLNEIMHKAIDDNKYYIVQHLLNYVNDKKL